jgi:trimethylamine-N-oxide reductase (cytochrome c)
MKDGYPWWPMRLNPEDARQRGIEDGEIVELFNDRGSVLGIALVTDRVPQGVGHSYGWSARYDPISDETGATDKAGCVNILTPARMVSKRVPGMASSSCLVEARKWR